ncbi:MAG: YgfZ/GcvT domain-containing protein [Chloroflexota bacterium]|jgi:folate-binding protein YgfZ
MTQLLAHSYPLRTYDEQSYGRIQMRGADSLALLQRLTTNDMLKLQPGAGCQTVLTTPIGRMMDVLHVVHAGDVIWVLTSRDQGPAVYSHLKKNIFFNDKVTLAPAGRSHHQIALYGNDATSWLASHYGVALANVPLWHAHLHDGAMFVRVAAVGGDGWRVILPSDGTHDSALRTVPTMSDAELALWQIEAGVPAFGAELTLDYIPLEAGLWSAISFSKGCYVGQEIIARMESRGRLAKNLTRVRMSQLHDTPAVITTSGGKEAGVLTRMAESPRYGHIGLAYLSTKIDAEEPLSINGDAVVRCDEHWQ